MRTLETSLVSRGSCVSWARTGTVLLLALAVAGPAVFASTDGPEDVKKLIKRASFANQKIADARAQVNVTFATYNAILTNDATDRTAAYKELKKQIAITDKRRNDVRKSLDEMQRESDKVFSAWNASLVEINDAELRERARQRLNGTKEKYAAIVASGIEARDLYEVFVRRLADQVTYLEHDLNAEGIASLQDQADKLRMEATDLFAKIDKAMIDINTYVLATNPDS